jgi:hypothetical protein
MTKTAITFGSALLFAGLLPVLSGMTPEVAAGTTETSVVTAEVDPRGQPAAKADRLEVRVPGAGCSQRAWPYYEPDCLVDFDARWRGEPRKVRVVTTDRVK